MYTRYLYEYEYVKSKLITAIISRNWEEMLFWASEIYFSGFTCDLWELIWTCFYTNYATINPHMESYIYRKMIENNYLDVLKNLLYRQQFTINTTTNNDINLKRGRKPKWVDAFTDNNHIKNVLLSSSLNVAHFVNVCKHNGLLIKLYECLVSWYSSTNGTTHTLTHTELVKSHTPKNQELLILSMIEMMQLPEDAINTKKIYLKADEDDQAYVNFINGNIDSDGKIVPAYKLLNERRIFGDNKPNPNIDVVDAESMLRDTPLWRERFDKFNLKDDDDRERFYEMYGYE